MIYVSNMFFTCPSRIVQHLCVKQDSVKVSAPEVNKYVEKNPEPWSSKKKRRAPRSEKEAPLDPAPAAGCSIIITRGRRIIPTL